MPIRSGDTVSFTGPGPEWTPESQARHDPNGVPRPHDAGEVVDVDGDMVRVAWRFGATTDCPIEHVEKAPPRSTPHRYRVTFEQFMEEDIAYTLVTEGGEAKAVYMATTALVHQHPRYRAWTVEVEDFGTEFEMDVEHDLLSWDEVS